MAGSMLFSKRKPGKRRPDRRKKSVHAAKHRTATHGAKHKGKPTRRAGGTAARAPIAQQTGVVIPPQGGAPTPIQAPQQTSAQPPPVISSTAAPTVATTAIPPVPPPPTPPAGTSVSSPVAMFSGTFGVAQATRLLWRAGFGPRPGDAENLAQLGLQAAVCSLTRPSGNANLIGPAPYNKDGSPLQPLSKQQQNALWWVDRMIRSDQQLVERLALTFHDWFATNQDDIPQILMLEQINKMRANCLGSFQDLVTAMVSDPALIIFLSGLKNVAWGVNENFGRELQELFTLGANDGYTQTDVHQISRALTGWQCVQGPDGLSDLENFYVDAKCHDWTNKTIYGQTGNFNWFDVARLVVNHPAHPEYFVSKLWSYFITTPPSSSDLSTLASAYTASGFQIRPTVEAILCHPDFYNDVNMVKPPAVYVVGLLRARQIFVDGETWDQNAGACGQILYEPPDVGGWNKTAWLNSNTMLGRWQTVYIVTARDAWGSVGWNWNSYPSPETPQQAVAAALTYWNNPQLRPDTMSALTSFASTCVSASSPPSVLAQRQNALRHMIAVSPDYQVC